MNTYFLGIAVTAFFKLCSPKHSNEMIVYIVQIKRNKYATKTDLSFDFFQLHYSEFCKVTTAVFLS